jgi:hypothetical protein
MFTPLGKADDTPTFYFSIDLIFSNSYLPNFRPPNLRLPRLPCSFGKWYRGSSGRWYWGNLRLPCEILLRRPDRGFHRGNLRISGQPLT